MTKKKYLEQLIAQQSQILELQKMELSLLKETINKLQGLMITHQEPTSLLNLPRQNFKIFNDIPLKVQLYDASQQLQGLPLSAFKDLRVSTMNPEAGWTFNYNINSDLIKSTVTGSGTVTQSNSKAILQTSATTSSTAKIETKKALRYQPGMGAMVRFTALFTTGVSGSTQIIGIGDVKDGFFFGYNDSSFGVLRRQNGVDNWIAQSSWNTDKFDGTGPSGIILDPTKGNVYSIQYQWLGFGMIYFYIENQYTGNMLLVHKIPYANANTNPSIFNPVLPIMAHVSNTTNNTNIKLETPSAMAFIEGIEDNNAIITRNSIGGSKTGITTEQAVITIRNKDTFQTKTNRVYIKLDYLSVSSDGTKTVTFHLVKNTTLGGTPSYSDISTNTSVIDYDTAGTTLSGGIRILNFKLAKVDSSQIILKPLNLKLYPGETLTVSATSSISTDIDVGISWEELW